MLERITLKTIKEEFSKYLVIRDEDVIDVVLAAAVGNFVVESDPVWMMLVANSSGGKSTFLAPLAAVPGITFIDDLTEKTFLSGYKVKGKESSLLKRIGNGMMVFSDFTSILGKNPNTRGEILTQFRMVYDGKFTKSTGVGEIAWEGKVGFIGASTPEIYAMLEQGKSMGERFIYYIIDQPTDREIVKKQSQVHMSSKEIAEKMKPLYLDYCTNIRAWVDINGMPELAITPEQEERLNQAAMFCVRAKATVRLDYKTGRPDAMPNQAGVGRDRKMLNSLTHALQIMDAYELDDWKRPLQDERLRIIDKSGYSSVNRERRKVMETLVAYGVQMSSSQIGAAGIGLEGAAVVRYLEPLHAVGLVKKKAGGQGKGHLWYMDNPDDIKFITAVSGVEKEDPDTLPEVEEPDEYNAKLIEEFDNQKF